MVPKKHKSKRLSASTKYKIKKKVTEHHRKARKEARNNPHQRKSLKKDPGVPNLVPFKEKLLVQAEDAKRAAEEEKIRAREARKLPAGMTSDQAELASLAQNAVRRGLAFSVGAAVSAEELDRRGGASSANADVSEAALSGRKDNSRKAFYREFKKVVENADVILEVLDARDPLGCRTRQIEELILNSGATKRIVLILNKIDLVPRENVEAWLKYLRNEFPTVAFKASTQNQRSNLAQSNVSTHVASDALLNSSESIGADNLVKLLKNYCRNLNIKTSITVGVVGFPNVGKSSVINSLKRSKACNVGATPGVTKVAQTIQLDKNIKLLDCPGIVFGRSQSDEDSAQVLLRNCVKVELLSDPVSPVELIVSRCNKQQLVDLYGIMPFTDTNDFLIQIARVRGRLRRGGIPNLESAARSVIQDWNTGRIPFYTIPPASGVAAESHVSSAIVSSWSTEFSLPEIAEVESKELLAGIKPANPSQKRMIAIKNSDVVAVDMSVEHLPRGYDDADMMDTRAHAIQTADEDQTDDIEEDDDEEDEEDDDAMEEDIDEDSMKTLAAMSAKKRSTAPEIRFKPVTKKLAGRGASANAAAAVTAPKRSTNRSGGLSPAETLINPQTNQQIRKSLKQKRRDQRREQRRSVTPATVDQDEDM